MFRSILHHRLTKMLGFRALSLWGTRLNRVWIFRACFLLVHARLASYWSVALGVPSCCQIYRQCRKCEFTVIYFYVSSCFLTMPKSCLRAGYTSSFRNESNFQLNKCVAWIFEFAAVWVLCACVNTRFVQTIFKETMNTVVQVVQQKKFVYKSLLSSTLSSTVTARYWKGSNGAWQRLN